jgi:cell division protein FtsZ
MMGTGEASGDRRAIEAAEAAISNPLLDDVCMKGSSGLLVSITGGNDLTLYEVDEAASRVRAEADPDANIIVGATFDNNLEGRIRVSVVATGTDATMVQALDPVKPNSNRAPISVRRPAPEAAPQQQLNRVVAEQRQSLPEIETQVEAAVAEAISHRSAEESYAEDDGVVVEPYIPAANHDLVEEQVRVDDVPVPSVYVPSHATRPDGQRRMPRTEELPAVARRSLDATDRQEQEPRNARALFRRLASNVGRNLRQQADEEPVEAGYPEADDAAARSAIEAGGARNSRVSGAPQGAQGQLDALGRQQAAPPVKERLEIPAFLRKHG